MIKLHIKNVGPVKEVSFELKRFNFFIGRQSSGKSTIAKIVSYCTWMEKEVQTHPDRQDDLVQYKKMFLPQLENFHSMHGYLRKDSVIEYESDYTVIRYGEGVCNITLKAKQTYERVKVLYVPAERAVAIRDMLQMKDNNIRSFAVDFDSARSHYDYVNRLNLGHLGIKYYQKMEDGELRNKVVADGKEYDIRLDDGSSGLQSIVPVAVAVDFYSKIFYQDGVEGKTLSVAQERDRRNVRNYLVKDGSSRATELRIGRLLETHRTNFVIEEPELNLYPTTQRDLLNFIVSCCNGRRKHTLTITTHSPYIINQLNLLLKAADKKDKVDGAAISFDELNVYAIQNGEIRDLKVKNEGVHLIDTARLSEDITDIYERYEAI